MRNLLLLLHKYKVKLKRLTELNNRNKLIHKLLPLLPLLPLLLLRLRQMDRKVGVELMVRFPLLLDCRLVLRLRRCNLMCNVFCCLTFWKRRELSFNFT